MSDPLSITAGVIAVAGLALTSCKTLNDTIKNFQNAPKSLSDIRRDLALVQDLLKSLLSTIGEDTNLALTPQQEECYRHLRTSLKQCQSTCDDFTKKLLQLTSRSGSTSISRLDRSRLALNENEILVFKLTLERDKQTLDVALGLATLNTVRHNRDALQSLESKISQSVSEFTGQLEGLQLAMRTIAANSTSALDQQQDLVLTHLNQQEQMLKNNLKVCERGLTELMEYVGTNVKHAVALDKARLFVGNMGLEATSSVEAPAIIVDFLGAKDQARAAAGNMSAEAARAFWS